MAKQNWVVLAAAVFEAGVSALVPRSDPLAALATEALEPEKNQLRRWREQRAEWDGFVASVTSWTEGRHAGDADIEIGLEAAADLLGKHGASMVRIAELNLDAEQIAQEVVAGDRRPREPMSEEVRDYAVLVFYQRLIGQNREALDRAVQRMLLLRAESNVRPTESGATAGLALDDAGVSDPPQLSATMRAVEDEVSKRALAAGTGVQASEIAQAIARRHPEYAEERLGTFSGTPVSGIERSWAEWRNEVAQLYDRSVVARSRHQVLDGRLFLVGLAAVEPRLRESFAATGIWVPLLMEIDESAAPDGSALWALLQERRLLAYGYSSDEASGVDQLGIQGEVNALCAVITDPSVKPPLAVGLFGEWGAGKSFFMDKMRERISDLAARDTRPGAEPQPLDVIQIRFNAWHYTDASLWASLAIEIFERLADPEPIAEAERAAWLRRLGDPKKAERKQLLEQLETYRDAKAALVAQRDEYKAQRADLDTRVIAARKRRREAARRSLTDVAGALGEDPEVQAALDRVKAELSVNPAVGELMGVAAELRTTAGYVPAVWRLIRHKTWAIALAATFVVLSVATAALLLGSGWQSLGGLATAAGSIAAAVIAAARLIGPAARQVNVAMGVVESAIRTAQRQEAQLRQQRSAEERELELELAEIDMDIAQASRAMAALDEKIAATEASVGALSVGQQLYDFITDRAAGYQQHQGVVGTLHRDFRLLDAKLRAYRHTGTREQGLPRVDRVILYVDDLDRCPPAKVLEVLEAVHLLLALELFVVVVGVDPRWLQRSLRHQYRDLVTSEDPHTDPYLRAMPIEYLEKIFQIPLTLPAMEPDGYARLIASLAPTTAAPVPKQTTKSVPAARRRTPTNESPGGDRAPTRGPIGVQEGSVASGSPARAIDLTPDEVAFAQRLAPLVDTPRAAKRLMNTYRLIRATRHVASRSRFLGHDGAAGEYRAVLTLLAIAAGYPTMLDRLLVALEEDAGPRGISRWSDFVAALDPSNARVGPQLAPEDLVGESANSPVDEEGTRWAALHEALLACGHEPEDDDLEPYQRWGTVVARFSFTL